MISIPSGLILILAMIAAFVVVAYFDLRTCNHCGKKRSDPPEWMEKYLNR